MQLDNRNLQSKNKYICPLEWPYIHTCRSYLHTPRELDRHAITVAFPALNFSSRRTVDSSDYGLLEE